METMLSTKSPLPHSIYDNEETEICLISKDPGSEYEKKVEASGFKGRVTVLGLSKLRTDYKEYEAKRQLCNLYDLFLTDDR